MRAEVALLSTSASTSPNVLYGASSSQVRVRGVIALRGALSIADAYAMLRRQNARQTRFV